MTLFQPNPEHEPADYEMRPEADDCWVTVRDQQGDGPGLSVRITRTERGVLVEVWPRTRELENPVATTYAFFVEP